MPNKKDLSGQIFGKIKVLKFSHSNKNRMSFYFCVCECGTEKVISGVNLTRTSRPTRSCGCSHIEQLKNLRSEDPIKMTAQKVWKANYKNGCNFEKFMELSQLPCHYCGVIKSNTYYMYGKNMSDIKISREWQEQCYFKYNGLDRIDSTKDHNEENIVPCCCNCNISKLDRTVEEFSEWIERVYKYFILKERK